ncbi:MAG TPA: DUF202 domain-containing protein [Acetobacteraceae bacterium]
MAKVAVPSADGLDTSTRLAFDRTRVAFERTMLSWVRTGISLITFGFSVYKFFQIEREPEVQGDMIGSQQFGLILVGMGLAALALGTLEYRLNMRKLRRGYATNPGWLVSLFAGSIAIVGIVAFVVMLIRR